MRLMMLLAMVACKNAGPTGTEADTDTDTDTDTDADADTDTDSDADTDTDTDTDVDTYTDGTWTTTVTVTDEPTLQRTYTFVTDHLQREFGPTVVTIVERAEDPVLRSGSLVFDGLFALAIEEARQNSVSTISDGAFANGDPADCECYQTGALWSYVWTRDTAYAADLGLAWLDPERTANSLRFKLSAPKAGGPAQIVQDTGTGGSWPVSTDRAIWSLGAQAVLDTLDGSARTDFLDDALEAALTTAEQDRTFVWDGADGLYRGEQSFLDWREQTYHSSTATNVVAIAESKSLSTNVAHWLLLDAVARWSDEVGNPAQSTLYRGRADQLAAAIQAGFWVDDQWNTLVGAALDPSVSGRRDLLAESLAALTIADANQRSTSLETYPHGPHGPSVIWPQQPNVPIYHNRAQWPFVTAYGLRAASRARNAAVFEAGAAELIRGAALNLSNMENAEWFTGEPWREDGNYTGPIVNSRRQLWSVAGYLSFVVDGLFGVRPSPAGLTFDPFVPAQIRTDWLDDTVTLHRFPWHGSTVDLTLQLPAGGGTVGAGTATPTTAGFTLAPVGIPASTVRTDVTAESDGFAPNEPVLDAPISGATGISLTWSGSAERFDVFRDGVQVASDVTSPWVDPSTFGVPGISWCYAIRATSGGRPAVHSLPQCWWGDQAARIQTLDAHHFVVNGGTWSTLNGRPHHQDWGAADHTLTVRFRPDWTGPHGLQWVYANGAGSINTGITAAHKRFRLSSPAGVVAEGSTVFPHTPGWDVYQESTLARVELEADTTYTLELSDAPNMTDLETMRAYTGGPGGGPDPYRFVDISALKLLAFDGVDQRLADNALGFDGLDDLAAFPVDQTLGPGAPLQPWSSFALEWDDDFVYVALVSEAFEDPFAPFVLYVEVDPGVAVPGTGLSYSNLVPELPFTPDVAIAVRRQHDGNDGFGPWSGLWTPDTAGWSQQQRFVEGRDVWFAQDQHTAAVRIPRHLIGDPSSIRLAGHVVNGVLAEEWKETVPAGHTPWVAGGTSLTVDLTGPHAATSWTEE